MSDCLFCKIINREVPAKIVYEDENIIAFPDIHPAADTHILVATKEHIKGIEVLQDQHGQLLTKIFQVIQQLVKDNNLENNLYRVAVNGPRTRHVDHLHFHLLGGNWKQMV